MILLIDAYNILKQIMHAGYIQDRQRAQFVEHLSVYARRKGHQIVAVFDGGDYERPYKELVRGIYVVYSGIHESADDVIRRYIEEHKTHDILLVSTDRTLTKWAAQCGVDSIDSLDFYTFLKQYHHAQQGEKKTTKSGPIKTSHSDDSALDALMREVGGVVTKSEDYQEVRVRQPHKKSKKERAIAKKINKL